MLSTEEASMLLIADGIELTAQQVAELARNKAFPGAVKSSDGRWNIPVEDLASFIDAAQKEKKRRRTKSRRTWFTAGTIGVVITVLGLFSIVRDTLDLARDYVIPTPTPSYPVCTVVVGEGNCTPVFDTPYVLRSEKPKGCVPSGARVEVIEMVMGLFQPFYRIGAYSYDRGPVVVTEVVPNSAGEKAGLQVGDVILQTDDLMLRDTDVGVLRDYIRMKADQSITMVIERDGRRRTLRPVVETRVLDTGETYGAIGFIMDGGISKGSGGFTPTLFVVCGP